MCTHDFITWISPTSWLKVSWPMGVNALIYTELKMPICFNFDKKKLNKIG